MLNNVSFVVDENNNKKSVLITYEDYIALQRIIEKLEDEQLAQLIKQSKDDKNNETIDTNEFLTELDKMNC